MSFSFPPSQDYIISKGHLLFHWDQECLLLLSYIRLINKKKILDKCYCLCGQYIQKTGSLWEWEAKGYSEVKTFSSTDVSCLATNSALWAYCNKIRIKLTGLSMKYIIEVGFCLYDHFWSKLYKSYKGKMLYPKCQKPHFFFISERYWKIV